MKRTSVFLFIVICLLCLSHSLIICQAGNIVFSSGFEEGSKDIWDDYDSNPDSTNLIMLHPGPFGRYGNHVMRFRVPPGRGGADLVKMLPGEYDKLYLRWYQMWETGYDFNARNHGSGLHAGNRYTLGISGNRPQGTDFFSTYFEPADGKPNLYTYYRGMYMDCANPQGQCWGDHFPCWFDEGQYICKKPQHRETIMPPKLETNRWYCFEVMLDAGTPVSEDSLADGVLNYWVDGVEFGPWTGLWFRTSPALKLKILWLSLFHHEAHSVEGILLDEVVVSTDKVGCPNFEAISENLFNTRDIDIRRENNGMIIYPPHSYTGLSVMIYNILGELCYKSPLISGQDNIIKSNLVNGQLYFIIIKSENKTENKYFIF